MNGNFGIDFFEKIIADVLTLVAARLVSETPHRNARVVFVTLVHSLHSVEVMRSPLDVVAQAVRIVGAVRNGVKAVGFDICFVNGIQSVQVAHRQKDGVGRIVRGSDRVAVIFFHQLNIGLKVVKAHRIALCHVGVVMVDAEHLNRLAVKKEYFAVDFNIPEADECPDSFNGFAIFFEQNSDFIDVRGLRCPLVNGKGLDFLLTDRIKDHAEKAVAGNLGAGVFRESPVECHRQVIGSVRIFLRSEEKIIDSAFVLQSDISITENAVFTEHILTLEIGAVAPFIDDGDDFVFALGGKARNVKLRRIVRTLRIADIRSVDIKSQSTRYAQKGDDLTGGLRKFDGFPVNTRSHIFGDLRRLFRERIAGVDVSDPVIARPLPGGGGYNFIKANRFTVERLGYFAEFLIVRKVPFAAEHNRTVGLIAFVFKVRAVKCRFVRKWDKIASCRKLVFFKHRKVGMKISFDFVRHGVGSLNRIILKIHRGFAGYQILDVRSQMLDVRSGCGKPGGFGEDTEKF